jgi:putative peptidoglycan lipid II flippase
VSQPFSLQAVSRSAFILTGGATLAQLLAVGRELFLAAQLGLSVELDALFIALALPATLAGVLTSGVVTALVPVYMGLRAESGPLEARRFAGGVIVWIGLFGLAASVLVALLAELAVAVTGPGLDSSGRVAAVGYLRLLAPLAFVATVSSILYAVCQAEERFAGIAAANLATPAVALTTIVLLWPSIGLTSVAIGSLLGPLVGAVFLYLTTVRAAMAPLPTLRVSRADLGAFTRHAAPLTLSAGVLQMNMVVDRAIASILAPGGVSALRFAELLARAPIGVIAPAWGSAIYPALVRAAGERDAAALGRATGRTMRYGIALFLPLAALTAVVSPVAVTVAYARGAFNAEDVALTIPIVAAFAPLVLILMVSPVLTGALNARQRGRVLLAGGMLNAVLNLVLDVALGATIGVVGIALSSSITPAIVLLYFVRHLDSQERDLDPRGIGRTMWLSAAAVAPGTLVIGALIWAGLVPAGLGPGLAALAIFGVVGILAYVGVAWLLRMIEIRTVVEYVRRWASSRRWTS